MFWVVEEWNLPPGSVLELDWYLCNLIQLQTFRAKQSNHDFDPVVHRISNIPWPAHGMDLNLKRKHDKITRVVSTRKPKFVSTTSICSYIVPNASATSFHSRESSNCTVNAMITSNATLNPHMQPAFFIVQSAYSQVFLSKNIFASLILVAR